MSRDFRSFFAYKIRHEAHVNRQKRFCEFSCFHEDVRLQSSKIACPRSHLLRGQAIFSFDTDIFLFLNYCY